MTLLLSTILILAVLIASIGLTGWFRERALALMMLDVPNARSSHTTAVPRGGGVAIVLSTLAAFLVLGSSGAVDWRTVGSLSLGGVVVAVVGFIDDRGHVPARWRLLGHFSAAALVLAGLGGFPRVSAWGITLGPGWAGLVVGALYVVWLLNLTNFMDGIDGIAAAEVITVCLGSALLSELAAPAEQLWLAPVLLASAALGFLAWNWPPAKIFMGDAGSGFLGLTMAALSLQAGRADAKLFWSWTILLGVFVVDATVTLMRRLARGERVYEAHRSHAYQHAALARRAHLPVTVAVAVINVCWLLPVAAAVALGRLEGAHGVLIAYAPLVLAALRLKAGTPSTA
jgi:Fuc2NAc and GlcNAc transferase